MHEEDLGNLRKTVEASAIAGLVSRLILHPIDTVKSRIQVAKMTGSIGMRSTVIGSFGGLYRGFTVAAAGSIPGVTLYFTSFHIFKGGMSDFPLPVVISDFTAGFLAEAVSCAFWVPVDIFKERLQVSQTLTLQEISRTLKFRGLYRGYFATLASYGPFSALYFTFVESLRRNIPGDQSDFFRNVLLSGSAGAAASLLTTPLDLVKLRLQVPDYQYSNFRVGLTEVARNEGIRGLFRGATPRVIFSALNTAITMSLIEFLRHRL